MIGVVGGTLSGLAAAAQLVRDGYEVRVFEPSDEPELGDPHAARPLSVSRPRDEPALETLAALGLAERLEWVPIRTAMYADGAVHPVDAPWEFLAYPPLSLGDTTRLSTLRSGIDVRGFPRRRPRFDAYDPDAYAAVPAEQFVRRHAGDAVYDRFYGPLLEARFGDLAPRVSAAWVLEHCRGERERTRFGRELRGFLPGGSSTLVDALCEAIGRERIETGVRVVDLERKSGSGALEAITLEREGSRERLSVDGVVLATDDDGVLETVGTDRSSVPVRTRTCLRVSTTATEPLTNAARVTMVDDAPFGELVTPPVTDVGDRGGHASRQCYLLDGGEAADAGHDERTVERRWLEALADRFAAFDRNDLTGVDCVRIRQPVPVARPAAETTPVDDAEDGDRDPLVPAGSPAAITDGVYDVSAVRQRQFPERSAGGALEAGRRCAIALETGRDAASASKRVNSVTH
ncbi:FAD-dependent oxidoreductase [Natronolimnohabitans innermongolicus]|uniref:Amine oxidase domain-containing protein n=1 Tax=Natronolimnohabitans innermongolicus JCM 12255 TaxID=1227499 RepID=L9WX86_9EURY|nr:FAD-dependent oxidoreductase [Natronolimnohabitans innermongolicus]ELY52968.1 hypothetical protein C493_15263 [Natronolimnohabitans innermongolicus JCM 12255]